MLVLLPDDVPIKAKHRLDSKLRRMVYTAGVPDLLPHDIQAGAVTARAGFNIDAPDASQVRKRILVKLGAGEPPQAFSNLSWTRIVDEIYTVDVPIGQLSELAQAEGIEYLSAGNRLGPTLDSALGETRADIVHEGTANLTSRTGQGVIVGIIDFGIDYTLDDFRDSNGDSRLLNIWHQGLVPSGSESSPAAFGYGVVYSQAEINTALGSADPFDVVRPRPQPGSHGTHVAGIATGNGRSADADFDADTFVGAAPEADIIFVQPDASDQDTSFTDSVHVTDAIQYIFSQAQAAGRPCVINMSLGQNGGSHDGESLVERAVDRLVETEAGRVMVVAAGNEHIWRGHASGQMATGDTREINWRFGGRMPIPGGGRTGGGNDRTPNEMEVWFSSRDRISVKVSDPDGDETDVVLPGNTEVFVLPSGDRVFIDSVRFSPLNGDSLIYVEVIPGTGFGSTLKSGIWTVELEALEVRDGRIDAWIERDFRAPDNNFADQSFFVGQDFDPNMTLGTPATNRRGVAVANYSDQTQSLSDSSSHGPTRDRRSKPEVAAPGTGVLSSNSLGGTGGEPVRVSMSGTSMSAPHVAGIVALMLEANPALTASQIRKILIASGRPQVGSTSTDFDNGFGFGRVDAVTASELAETA